MRSRFIISLLRSIAGSSDAPVDVLLAFSRVGASPDPRRPSQIFLPGPASRQTRSLVILEGARTLVIQQSSPCSGVAFIGVTVAAEKMPSPAAAGAGLFLPILFGIVVGAALAYFVNRSQQNAFVQQEEGARRRGEAACDHAVDLFLSTFPRCAASLRHKGLVI